MSNKSAAFLPIGMGMGIAIGTALGVATDNLALGLALGVAFGAGFGGLMTIAGGNKEKKKDTGSGDSGGVHTSGDSPDRYAGDAGDSGDGGGGDGGGGD
jgi:hypothetical protein